MANLSRPARLAAVVLLCLLTTACLKNKVTKENFEKIKTGMTLDECEKILGKGSKETGDGSNVAGQFGVAVVSAPTVGGGDVYVWEKGDKKITITLRQDKVVHKASSGF